MSKQEKLSKQAKLKNALAEIKAMPDAYFDALMHEMGLSTARTFPDASDTPTETPNKQKPTPHKQPDTPKSTS